MRTSLRTFLGAGAAATALAALAVSVTAAPAAASARSCGKPGYAYAGLQSAHRAHGVRATLRPVSTPAVDGGHVAAWVGVGGPNAGPGGTDAWVQVGLSAFAWERTSKLYYEVTRPGASPVYTQVLDAVPAGRRHRVAVLETQRRDWWRVWVDGRAVSAPIHLPGSSGKWHPIATAETWDGGRRSCNRFEYSFERVGIARSRGGSWSRFVGGYRFQDSGFRVVPRARGSFLARTTVLPPRVATQVRPASQRQAPAAPAPAAAPAPPAPPAPAAPPAPPASAPPVGAEAPPAEDAPPPPAEPAGGLEDRLPE